MLLKSKDVAFKTIKGNSKIEGKNCLTQRDISSVLCFCVRLCSKIANIVVRLH